MTTPTPPSPAIPPERSAFDDAHGHAAEESLPDRGRLRACMVIVLTLALAGVGCGIAWAVLAPDIELIMTQVGPLPASELDAGRLVAMDSWYAVLAGVIGLMLGAVLATFFLRQGVVMVVALIAGACLAAVLASAAGSLVANGTVVWTADPAATVDTTVAAPLRLHAYGYLFAWPIAVLAPVVPLAWLGWLDDDRPAGISATSLSTGRPTGQQEPPALR
ncbi:hypothetical protein ABN028_14435 [Actinopolymorpha sp. B17G11]|uniref:hypothetical protein n=1 Tax=Actinopolymorpha sp. B17G11 TaxID=3160861 RepID=UPI0032E3D120